MIKKITLIFLLCCIIVSCGKKGVLEYKDPEKKAKIQTILTGRI
tara:strand:- start:2299 stop:2430 length:132 start_codon:yes stop_codon:yes gene_type:complete